MEATKLGRRETGALTLGALGVVFGDLGTSPLYALRECLTPGRGIVLSPEPVIGVVSLLVWTLILVVCGKYIGVVLRADNRGEGGILALVSLLSRPWAVAVGIVGAALLYADGVLTPAVSVLSAWEGLTVLSDQFQPWVIPLSLAVLAGLFAVQSRGTGRVSAYFGPVIAVWFIVLAMLGVAGILRQPAILAALNPAAAVGFVAKQPLVAFTTLGSVFLAVTGTEALYADLGHFGRRAISRAWYWAAFPALMLNYLGQGGLVLSDPGATANLFFRLAPEWFLAPLVILATAATVIASQAVITGAFSLARQSIQLGLWPRLTVRHTSARTAGQVFVPFVNAVLFFGTAALVLGFGASAKLADAYGIAVSGTMLLTTVLLAAAARKRWGMPWPVLGAGVLIVGSIDLVFFAANATKIFAGGWIVLGTALVLTTLMFIWGRGRRMVASKVERLRLPFREFAASLRESALPPQRVDRTAVFLSGQQGITPGALLHNLKHNQVLHRPTLVLHVATVEEPTVAEDRRTEVADLGSGLYEVQLRYGFSESPDLPEALRKLESLVGPAEAVTYFLGKQTLVIRPTRNLGCRAADQVFAFLVHNATDATAYYGLPPGQVVELGGRLELGGSSKASESR